MISMVTRLQGGEQAYHEPLTAMLRCTPGHAGRLQPGSPQSPQGKTRQQKAQACLSLDLAGSSVLGQASVAQHLSHAGFTRQNAQASHGGPAPR